MTEMERSKFVSRRSRLAQQIFNGLKTHPPLGAIAVDRPDDLGAVGVDFGINESGENEYILIQIEDGTLKEKENTEMNQVVNLRPSNKNG